MQRKATNPTPAPVPPRAPASPEKEQSDWCGSDGTEWVPDFPGFPINKACRDHDINYGTPGKSKTESDRQLFFDGAASGGFTPHALATSLIYSLAVSLLGNDAYKNAQNKSKAKP